MKKKTNIVLTCLQGVGVEVEVEIIIHRMKTMILSQLNVRLGIDSIF